MLDQLVRNEVDGLDQFDLSNLIAPTLPLLMQAPAPVSPERLRELHIRLDLPPTRRSGT